MFPVTSFIRSYATTRRSEDDEDLAGASNFSKGKKAAAAGAAAAAAVRSYATTRRSEGDDASLAATSKVSEGKEAAAGAAAAASASDEEENALLWTFRKDLLESPKTSSKALLKRYDELIERNPQRSRYDITCTDDVETIAALLHRICDTREWKRAPVLVELLESAANTVNNNDTNNNMWHTSSRTTDSSCLIEGKLQHTVLHALVRFASETKDDARIIDVCDAYESRGHTLPTDVFPELFRACISVEQPERAMMCIDAMPKAAVEIDHYMYTQCAALCGKLGAVDALLLLLEKIVHDRARSQQKNDSLLARTLEIGVSSALTKGHVECVCDVLSAIQHTDIQLSGRLRFDIFKAMLDETDGSTARSPMRAFRFVCDQKDVSVAKVSQIMSACLKFNTRSYKRDACQIFDEACEIGVKPDKGLYALAIGAHFRLRKYGMILRLFDAMTEGGEGEDARRRRRGGEKERIDNIGGAKRNGELSTKREAIVLHSVQLACLRVRGIDAMRDFTNTHATDIPSCLTSAAAKVVHTCKGDQTDLALSYLESYANLADAVENESPQLFYDTVWRHVTSSSNAIADSARRREDGDKAQRLQLVVSEILSRWTRANGRSASAKWRKGAKRHVGSI